MSEAAASKCEQLKPYAYNQQEDPSILSYQVVYQHFFSENCGVLTSIVPTYFTFAGAWATLAAFSTAHLYLFTPSDSRLSLQKSLLLLPALKAMEVFLEGIWLDYCPWVGMSNSAYQYI